ncbi:MAG TPA: hypothetical protein VLH37_09645 [Bacteroidales bacterium]|nr:hypothetical protein [Bacteroidales bacterium]
MSVRQALIKGPRLENILTDFYKSEMVSYLEANPAEIEQAIKLAIADVPRYSWRAAWLVCSCMDDNDSRVADYVKEIIERLPAKCDNHQRELLKILQRMELTEECEGPLFDICCKIWENTANQQSVRYNAIRLILKIVEKHPDLRNEIAFLTESQYLETLSEGVKKSIARMIADYRRD